MSTNDFWENQFFLLFHDLLHSRTLFPSYFQHFQLIWGCQVDANFEPIWVFVRRKVSFSPFGLFLVDFEGFEQWDVYQTLSTSFFRSAYFFVPLQFGCVTIAGIVVWGNSCSFSILPPFAFLKVFAGSSSYARANLRSALFIFSIKIFLFLYSYILNQFLTNNTNCLL